MSSFVEEFEGRKSQKKNVGILDQVRKKKMKNAGGGGSELHLPGGNQKSWGGGESPQHACFLGKGFGRESDGRNKAQQTGMYPVEKRKGNYQGRNIG